MSYEGYDQCICANGHYWTEDLTYLEDDEMKCPFCEAKIAWFNSVDCTNGDNPRTGQGYGYIEPVIETPEEVAICKECGHKKVLAPAKYKVFTQVETERLKCLEAELNEKFFEENPGAY